MDTSDIGWYETDINESSVVSGIYKEGLYEYKEEIVLKAVEEYFKKTINWGNILGE